VIYVLTGLGIPTLACMLHARLQDDGDSFQGGLVFLGVTVLLAIAAFPLLGFD
jgi:hypothetical protein